MHEYKLRGNVAGDAPSDTSRVFGILLGIILACCRVLQLRGLHETGWIDAYLIVPVSCAGPVSLALVVAGCMSYIAEGSLLTSCSSLAQSARQECYGDFAGDFVLLLEIDSKAYLLFLPFLHRDLLLCRDLLHRALLHHELLALLLQRDHLLACLVPATLWAEVLKHVE